MGKRRRLASTNLPSSSKIKLECQDDDVMVARDRLKGALEGLIHSEDESSSSQDEAPVIPCKPIKREIRPQLIRRRKRKEPLEVEQNYRHTFVMKLFDRSVDLAQFKESTPLYPICRAWVANAPNSRIPAIETDSEQVKKKGTKDEKLEISDKDVFNLPPPSHPPISRIPSISPPKLRGVNLDYNVLDSLPTADTLLKDHIHRWRQIRQTWLEAEQKNDARYNESAKLLSKMLKKTV